MHTDWTSAVGSKISSKVRFEVVHAYSAQQCFFFPLPHVQVGIQTASATSEKTKDPSLHKGNTGSHTKVYTQKGLTAMEGVDSYEPFHMRTVQSL